MTDGVQFGVLLWAFMITNKPIALSVYLRLMAACIDNMTSSSDVWKEAQEEPHTSKTKKRTKDPTSFMSACLF